MRGVSRSRLAVAVALTLGLGSVTVRPNDATVVAEAERLGGEALRLTSQDAAQALRKAREALALTAEFVPIAFVDAGRKGEVVEDEFQAARDAYRRHRARLYGVVGEALAAGGSPVAASRYLRRSCLLDPQPERALALARAETALGRGREAMAAAQRAVQGLATISPEAATLIARAADVAGLPSAQAEIDRGRLTTALGQGVTLRDGPVALPPGVRLSTMPIVRLEDAPVNLIYVSEATCRSCSADLQDLRRMVPEGVRVLMLPEVEEQDVALRQVLSLYRHPWAILLGRNLPARLGLEARDVLLVARGGWTAAVMRPPFGPGLTSALQILQRTDLQESVPRAGWNRLPVDRSPLRPPPALLPEGLAPGEDEPFPPEFEAAVEAYRGGRYRVARQAFDALEGRGDGWLLPPEARLNRALCLAGMGQRDAARRILLRTGDSRFEEEVDRVLEIVAAAGSEAR